MVHQEQLALVVTDVVAESERSVDDLLRATHRQRGLGGEVLQRGPMSVDRRVVEVRPELPDGVLAVLPHENLAAEPDDGLVGRAVPGVLETAAAEGGPFGR